MAKTYSYLYEAANRKGGLTFAKTTFQQALMDAVQEEADKYVAKDADSKPRNPARLWIDHLQQQFSESEIPGVPLYVFQNTVQCLRIKQMLVQQGYQQIP